MTLLFCVLYLFIYTSLFLSAFKVIIMSYGCYSKFLMNLFCEKNGVIHLSLIGLIASETPRVPNVIESSSVNTKPADVITLPTSPTSTPPPAAVKRKDLGGIGFIDDIGGGVDGLMSCTESLGFESCDERRVDDDDHRKNMAMCDDDGEMAGDACRRKRIEEKIRERKNKKFPPPLSSLNQNGQPCFYLKPVRENGRLELTKVKIKRREILHAVRQNGRLRLHLVSSHVCSKINEEQEETKQEEQEVTNQEEQEQEQELHLQEKSKVEELCNCRMSGERFKRCHELVMSHHHHHHHLPNINDHHSLHVWRQPYVTTG